MAAYFRKSLRAGNPRNAGKVVLYLDRSTRAAFTLLELLVVIAIIGILAALLLGSLAKTKAKALQVPCMGNLRQLSLCWKMYADDNQGKLVRVFYFSGEKVNTNAWVLGSMDDNKNQYPRVEKGVLDSTNLNGIKMGSLYRYANSPGIYHCPADQSVNKKGNARVRSYSINGWMGGTSVHGETQYQVFHRESEIMNPSPANAWVFIDEHEKSINDGWFAVEMKGDEGLLDIPATRHNNAYGLTFADGHAEIWKLQDERTIHWESKPVPNDPINPDWKKLSAATTSLLPTN